MKLKKVLISSVLGLIFGLICSYMATIRQPIPLTGLIIFATIYTRTLAGFFIGIIDWSIVKNKWLNAILEGFILGFLISLPLSIPFGFSGAIGFSIFGGIYGSIIDLIILAMFSQRQ